MVLIGSETGKDGYRYVDLTRLSATVLASYNSRSRVVRDREGGIHLFWKSLGIRMTQDEFLGLVGLVKDAAACAARCGELAMHPCGRAVRCPMGQIMLSHGNLTLWFSPEEFAQFCRLGAAAQQHLADVEPLPPLGLPWKPAYQDPQALN